MATYTSILPQIDYSAIGIDVDREQTECGQHTDGNQDEEKTEQIGSTTCEISLRGQGVNHKAQNNDARCRERTDKNTLINEDTTTSDQEGFKYRLRRDEKGQTNTKTNSIMRSIGCFLMPTHNTSLVPFTGRGACDRE